MPERIQRKRTKGWRMPEGAVYVGRPTRWGNPFKVDQPHPSHGWPMSRFETVELFASIIKDPESRYAPMGIEVPYAAEVRRLLAGHDLVCWCPLDQPCHADVLLEVANQ